MPDLPLRPVPSGDWQREFDRLMRDDYLRKKYNREARVKEHLEYIRAYIPEITKSGKGLVVDIGPGAGEFLEWCRKFGWQTLGIEAVSGDGGMGDEYLRLSKLMHERQKIDVRYCGWQGFVEYLHSGTCTLKAALFNLRGSWAQCYADFVDGPAHHLHHDVRQQRWRFGETLRLRWQRAFMVMGQHLLPEGRILIVANRLGEKSDQDQYCEEIRRAADDAGLVLVKHESNYVHQWERA